MGYTTEFEGQFNLDTPMTEEQIAYFNAFNETRRMARNPDELQVTDVMLDAGINELGVEGEFYVSDNRASFGQEAREGVTHYNNPPSTQPGLWCQWTVSDDGKHIMWDGGEKFYYYTEWLTYLIDNFLKQWGLDLNGEVEWVGECGETGTITVLNNKIVCPANV